MKRPASELSHRPAVLTDIPILTDIMDKAILQLQKSFLTDAQIESSRTIMGLDTTLIEDGTYFIVFLNDVPAGCGGWSRRETLYGGDHTPDRQARLLDPSVEAARVRAMYTHPDFARRGVGTRILELCECAAAAAGFSHCELMATLSGEPLYAARGYSSVERISDDRGGHPVPLVRMTKTLRDPESHT